VGLIDQAVGLLRCEIRVTGTYEYVSGVLCDGVKEKWRSDDLKKWPIGSTKKTKLSRKHWRPHDLNTLT
jgi:hypothetical protein